MREFGPSEQDVKFSAPKESKGRFRSAMERLARKLALIGVLAAGAEQMATAQQAHAGDKHRIAHSEPEKAIEARELQLNKWLEVFRIKTLGVREASYNNDPHEQLDLYIMGKKNAILDAGGLIGTSRGQEPASPAAEKFDEEMLKRYVIQYLEGHTDFKVIDAARPGYKKEHEKNQESGAPQMHREDAGGINIEYSQEAGRVMQQTGVRLSGGGIELADGRKIDFNHWQKVKQVVIRSQGNENLFVEIHHGKKEVLTERITKGVFSGTFSGEINH